MLLCPFYRWGSLKRLHDPPEVTELGSTGSAGSQVFPHSSAPVLNLQDAGISQRIVTSASVTEKKDRDDSRLPAMPTAASSVPSPCVPNPEGPNGWLLGRLPQRGHAPKPVNPPPRNSPYLKESPRLPAARCHLRLEASPRPLAPHLYLRLQQLGAVAMRL